MKNIFIILALAIFTQSCVSKKMYQELETKYNKLKNRNQDLVGENDDLFAAKKRLESENNNLKKSVDSLQNAKQNLLDDVTALDERKRQFEKDFAALSHSSNEQLNAKAKEILRLTQDLNDKENALIAEKARLEKLQQDLDQRSERIEQLEELIASKEAAMQQLKDAVSNALANFEGNGLTVERKNGKVYVSMENKLLFNSGSWSVGNQGKKAVSQLADVLKKNPDIEVLIEGHTDNVPYQSNGAIKDNWDLSTKRATAIVRILTNKGVQPKRVTAAGRGEFFPVASNNTKEGRAKNRRIEIILAPNLDKINALLK
jgi:chemotaxis protein MotB